MALMNQPQVEAIEDYMGLIKGGAEVVEGLAMTGANMYKTIMETKKQPKVESYMEQSIVDYRPSRVVYETPSY